MDNRMQEKTENEIEAVAIYRIIGMHMSHITGGYGILGYLRIRIYI